jgi:agmatinase
VSFVVYIFVCSLSCVLYFKTNFLSVFVVKKKLTMTKTNQNDVAIIGIPFDDNSSFVKGAALAPPRIRQAFHSPSTNLFTENLTDLSTAASLSDLGDLRFAEGTDAFSLIESTVHAALKQETRLFCLGGDHSITYPILKAYASTNQPLTIVQLDAHPDLYHEFEGNRFSHACPFARIMEEQLAKHLVQIGIRGMNKHQFEQARRFQVHTIDMRTWHKNPSLKIKGPVYLSLDMDVLDPAYAPGVSHPEGGGMTTREVIDIIQNLPGPLIGADLVEYNPNHDPTGITDVAAAKLMKEILTRLLEA